MTIQDLFALFANCTTIEEISEAFPNEIEGFLVGNRVYALCEDGLAMIEVEPGEVGFYRGAQAAMHWSVYYNKIQNFAYAEQALRARLANP